MREVNVKYITYDGGQPEIGRKGADVLSEDFSMIVNGGRDVLGTLHTIALPIPIASVMPQTLSVSTLTLYPNILARLKEPFLSMVAPKMGRSGPFMLMGKEAEETWGAPNYGEIKPPDPFNIGGKGFFPKVIMLDHRAGSRFVTSWDIMGVPGWEAMLKTSHRNHFVSLSLQLGDYLRFLSELPEEIVAVHRLPPLLADEISTQVITDSTEIAQILAKRNPDTYLDYDPDRPRNLLVT
jgi:hypothetical protein